MSEEKKYGPGVSPISGVAPPAAGKWKPGQSGNPKGRPPLKPFKEAMAPRKYFWSSVNSARRTAGRLPFVTVPPLLDLELVPFICIFFLID